MPTITKLCFAIILSKLCLVEPSSTLHLAEDGQAKLWTQISSRSPEGERGWRSGTLMSEQVPVHFTRLPLFPYRALWAQLHPWTFTCFSVRILQACLNWLSQPSILRRRTEKKSLQSLLLHLPAALHQHAHLRSLLRYSTMPPGAAWQQLSQNNIFQTPKTQYWYPNGDQQSFTLLLVQLSPWAAFWLSRQGHSFFTTPGHRGGENAAAQDRASPLELTTGAASQQKAIVPFGYAGGAFHKLHTWESPAEALNQPASQHRQRKQYLEPCPSVQAGKATVSDEILPI